MANILFKFPTRGRPEKFKKILELYYNNLSNKHNCEFIITSDLDDNTMNNDEMKKYLSKKNNLSIYFGNNKNKIQAVNADIEKAKINWDYVFLISDDMIVKTKNFDDIIYQDFIKYFPNFDGALHYNDGHAGEKLNTLSILGRKLYDYFGYIYNEDYVSLWADNEFDEVTKKSNKSKYIDNVIVEHEWKNDDNLYAVNNKWYNRDWQMYEKRKVLGFPLERITEKILSAKDEVDMKSKPIPSNKIIQNNEFKPSSSASKTLKRLYESIQENKKRFNKK